MSCPRACLSFAKSTAPPVLLAVACGIAGAGANCDWRRLDNELMATTVACSCVCAWGGGKGGGAGAGVGGLTAVAAAAMADSDDATEGPWDAATAAWASNMTCCRVLAGRFCNPSVASCPGSDGYSLLICSMRISAAMGSKPGTLRLWMMLLPLPLPLLLLLLESFELL